MLFKRREPCQPTDIQAKKTRHHQFIDKMPSTHTLHYLPVVISIASKARTCVQGSLRNRPNWGVSRRALRIHSFSVLMTF